MDDTRLVLKEGEQVSSSTKRMQLINEAEITYERRIDLIVATDFDADNDTDDIEICSIEFKKSNATTTLLLQQQNKNLRINSCILNEIHLSTQDNDNQLIYFDYDGKFSYIVQLYRYENFFVGHKIGSFAMISSLLELQHLQKKSVTNLYSWRESALELSNKILLSHINQSYKYDLIEVSGSTSNTSIRSPKRSLSPVKIHIFITQQSVTARL